MAPKWIVMWSLMDDESCWWGCDLAQAWTGEGAIDAVAERLGIPTDLFTSVSAFMPTDDQDLPTYT
jgi:hypothetical protein